MEATLHCARCDYDLRMLDPAGVCPECAWPIKESIEDTRNPFKHARRSLRVGATLILLAMVIWFVVAVVVANAYVGVGELRGAISSIADLLDVWPARDNIAQAFALFTGSHRVWEPMEVLGAALIMSFVLELIGLWLLTRQRIFKMRMPYRWLTRWLALMQVAGYVLLDGAQLRRYPDYIFVYAAAFVLKPAIVVSAALYVRILVYRLRPARYLWLITSVAGVGAVAGAFVEWQKKGDLQQICAAIDATLTFAAFFWLVARLRGAVSLDSAVRTVHSDEVAPSTSGAAK